MGVLGGSALESLSENESGVEVYRLPLEKLNYVKKAAVRQVQGDLPYGNSRRCGVQEAKSYQSHVVAAQMVQNLKVKSSGAL